MSFSEENGYIPGSIESIMQDVMTNINAQFGTSYTYGTFVGSNFYKYFYALVQKLQENEVKTSEIFLYLRQYFDITNESIQRPVATNPGIIEAFERAGYIASVKAMVLADAGKMSICVDVDDGDHAYGNITITNYTNLLTGTPDTVTIGATVFTAQAGVATLGTGTFQAATSNIITAASLATQINAHATTSLSVRATAIGAMVKIRAVNGGTAGNSYAINYTDNGGGNIGATKSGTVLSGGTDSATYSADKLEIATIIMNSISGGIVTQGTESTAIVLSNGQSFDWKFYLPNRIDNLLKLTVTTSENNQLAISNPEDIKQLLLTNILSRYKLGKNFEPQRYFSQLDAPWSSQVLLEWSIDGGSSYSSSVYDAAFDDLFDIQLANITLIEN